MSIQVLSKRSRKLKPLIVVVWAVGLIAMLAWAAPLVWMVSTSVKLPSEVMTRNVEWFPRHLTIENYAKVLEKPVLRWLVNSIVVATSATAASLLTGSLVGFALAQLNFPGRSLLFFMVLASLMIPTEMTIVPLFLGFLKVGLINNLLAMIVPGVASVFSVYLFRNFFLSLPPELLDAAAIDGANRLRTYWSVALPLAKPAVIAGGILLFTGYCNAFLWPLLVASSIDVKTMPVGLAAYSPQSGVSQYTQIEGFAPAMAAMTLLTLPSLLVFLVLQRHFIEGATSAGIKG